MKKIKGILTANVRVSTTGTAIDIEVFKDFSANRMRVIETALTVERQLEEVILHYFMGKVSERREAFESMILNSDWCSFASKRKLVKRIIDELNLLEGKEKTHFEELVGQIMRFRNAFTHGRLSYAPPNYWLSYFEGLPKKEQLSDEYLEKVEKTLFQATEMASNLAIKIGARS